METKKIRKSGQNGNKNGPKWSRKEGLLLPVKANMSEETCKVSVAPW